VLYTFVYQLGFLYQLNCSIILWISVPLLYTCARGTTGEWTAAIVRCADGERSQTGAIQRSQTVRTALSPDWERHGGRTEDARAV